jgi:hypothetical protein
MSLAPAYSKAEQLTKMSDIDEFWVQALQLCLLVSQGVISHNYDDSQYDGLILDFDC